MRVAFRSVKRNGKKRPRPIHPPREAIPRGYRAPRTARARCRSSDHDKTPLKIRKKKKRLRPKNKKHRGAFVSFDRVATRVAPSWPLFPLFTFFLGPALLRPTHTASPRSSTRKLSSISKPLGMQCCRYSDEHAYPTRPGMWLANKPHLSPAPCSVATATNRSISCCDHSPCRAASPGRLCR